MSQESEMAVDPFEILEDGPVLDDKPVEPTIENLVALSDELVIKRNERAAAEAAHKEAGQKIIEIEDKIATILGALDMQNFSRHGKMFYQIPESYPTIKDQDGFYQYLASINEDGIIKRTIHPKTLQAWYKQHALELGEKLTAKPDGEDSLPMLSVFERIKIGVRKASGGKK